MFSSFPADLTEMMDWSWSEYEPFFAELQTRPIHSENVSNWLKDWSDLATKIMQTYWRLYVAMTVDTTDAEAERRHAKFLDTVHSSFQAANQKLKLKLIDSHLHPEGFDVPLRNMRAEADLYREANLALLADELKLSANSDKITGDQTVVWEGKENTIYQIQTAFQDPDRGKREGAWRSMAQRRLADREALNALWIELLDVRRQIFVNADLPDYRAYRWLQLLRFDYTPQDCYHFHQAIEEIVVPAAERIYEKRRERLGLEQLRPWDLDVDPLSLPPLRPFTSIDELEQKTADIFHRVDPQLGSYFDIMRNAALLDLDSRKGKAPGGYCTDLSVGKGPFIFANAVGIHDDVITLLHEGGHAFHVFEMMHLPYVQQLQVGIEFLEVASMGMEFLGSPYLAGNSDSFYNPQEGARARIQHLEEAILFWPYMAVVDSFQHWVYENHQAAMDPKGCDAKWAELWDRFMKGVDWSGLEPEKMTGWQRKMHIFQVPFYFIEYGIAQLGAMQLFRNAQSDQAGAVAAYRKALALGGTAPLPEIFATAGIQFDFSAKILQEIIDLAEETIAKLEMI